MENKFRSLPSVDKLLSDSRIKQLGDSYPHNLLVDIIRQKLEHARLLISQDKSSPSYDEIIESIGDHIRQLALPGPRYLVNATGVILHTNLGRAPLSKEAIAAMDEASRGYCDLEFELGSGTRGSRNVHIEKLLCQLTGAEAALVVNNNASAVLLGLTALARRKEVIVSRGQAVEIGGGFRIPEVMKQSGAKLVEVGTTNCTYAADFEQAITPRTAALLRVHSSNFKVIGFAEMATLEELVALANKHGIPLFDDLGSGCLLDTTQFGLDPEPMVQKSVALGVGLTFFSGDKLLGGPQSGIIVGKKQLVDRLKKHPMARAVRIDKIRLAGLAATLTHYLKGEELKAIPVWRMIAAPLAEIEKRARDWSQEFGDHARVVEGQSMVGGGSLPGGTLPTRLVAIGKQGKIREHGLAQTLAGMLRSQRPPVVGRISEDVLLLDPRSVLPEEDHVVIHALRTAAASLRAEDRI
jgi:L-seryl-tRNA(Ser) seleniumtransferase